MDTDFGRTEPSGVAEQRCLVIVDPVAHFFRYVTSAKSLGLKVIVLSSNEAVCREEEAGHMRYAPDYAEGRGIDAFLTYEANSDCSALAALEPYRDAIAGLVAGDEVTVALTARLGCALGFPYASPDDAACQQIKSLMKARLVERAVRTPQFSAVSSWQEAVDAWHRFGGDCMVKMVDYAMSYGIYRVRTEDQLAAAWAEIADRRAQLDHGFAPVETVLLEEYVGGREFSVEGYEQNGRIVILNICEKLSHPNFMVVGHYIPAHVDPQEGTELETVARACVAALSIRNSIFHAELHIRDRKAHVIECAARPPGQYSVLAMKRAYGFDITEISIRLACGMPVTVAPTDPASWHAIMALYSNKTGIVKRVEALDELKARSECYLLKCDVVAGDPVHRLETFRDVLGLALMEAEDPAAIRSLYEWARDSVRFAV